MRGLFRQLDELLRIHGRRLSSVDRLWRARRDFQRRHNSDPWCCSAMAYGEGEGRSRSGPTSIRSVVSRMQPHA